MPRKPSRVSAGEHVGRTRTRSPFAGTFGPRLGVVLAVAEWSALHAAPLVHIRSHADQAYVETRAVQNPPRPETYVFYQGKFFPGEIVDRTLERMPFLRIVQSLAPHLKQQNFLPAQSLAEADLVLVVHWGTTVGRNRGDALAALSLQSDTQAKLADATGDFERARAQAETSGLTSELADSLRDGERRISEYGRDRAQAIDFTRLGQDLATSNAALLGVADVLWAEGRSAVVSSTAQTLDAMLDEDRYFLILIAYDRAALVNDGIARRVWSARISMRSAGVNFREALNHLGAMGGDFFGQQSERMVIRKSRAMDDANRSVDVTIGELKIVESGPPQR